MSARKTALALGVAAGMAAVGAGIWALAVEPQLLELTRTELLLPRLPATLDGASILLLSDMHVRQWGRREDALLALLAELPTPDLIVWGGDFLGAHGDVNRALRLVVDAMAHFDGVPALAVRGNAEHKIGKARRLWLEEGMAASGVRMLVNEHLAFDWKGTTITVAGVDDAYYGWADLDAALDGVPTDRFLLLISHSPQLAALAAPRGVDLMLSGHTHGGQVRVPGYGAVKTQNPLSRRLDCGVFDRSALAEILGRDPGGDMVTAISRGIGLANVPHVPWLAPRLFCRPEVMWLTLRQQKAHNKLTAASICAPESQLLEDQVP